ncbi:MAG: diguanylate cyclase [Deltaproteobacteria bacterium]|nr:MAG: diguanylate cyclase [Deltaproteobacteria bacterium]
MKRRTLKRALRVGGGAVVSLAACAAVAAGGLDGGARDEPPAAAVMLAASIVALLIASVSARLRFVEPSARAQRVSRLLRAAPALIDVQLGLALAAGNYAVIAATGGAQSPAYPLLYGVIAFSVSFQAAPAAWATVVGAIALEAAAYARGPGGAGAAAAAALHVGFIGASAAAHALFVRGLLRRQRAVRAERLAAEVRALREEARDYRLIAAALGPDSRAPRSRTDQERKLADGAVEALRSSVFYTLGLVQRALGARTTALLWLDATGEQFKIKELVSESDAVTERRVVPVRGPLRAVVRDRTAIALPAVKSSQLPYYELPERPAAFVAVPVMDGPHLRGVLCADRPEPFDDAACELLHGATEQLVRAIESEQVFIAVERSKYELEQFFRASDMLCRALTPEQVMDTAFDAAAAIVDADLMAIALYDRERRRHRIADVRVKPGSGIGTVGIAGLEFRDNAGLASMVVKNKHYLPASGAPRDATTPIFTKKIKLKGVESLLVLPLLCADEAIGTFTLASAERGRFGKDVRDMLGIIANQVAVSLQNAGMYRKMETMATTDGLTGLMNHRTFQERAADMIERAARHGHKVGLLLTDVDHFKKVNDTYGHPVGDEVLRRVAQVLGAAVRKIDVVARYGGEEFVVLLEAVDEAGAVGLADRIRQDVAAQVVDTEKGPLQVTMSFGVAMFPDDADRREDLIERADMALYRAKESGRNRVVTYREFVAARQRRAG